jgi:hypothetical protein
MGWFETLFKISVLQGVWPWLVTGLLFGMCLSWWRELKRSIRILRAGDDLLDALINGRHRADDEREDVNVRAVKAWLEARK